MSPELALLTTSAAAIGFFHTLLGPDHYLPFAAMSRAGNWSRTKTIVVTVLCGIGHVAGSIFLGMLGIAMGIAVTRLEAVESVRGDIAAWSLIAIGLVYFVWGMRKAAKKRSRHGARRASETKNVSYTPWILFTVFVLGPCEPLIPLLMYPAAKESLAGVLIVISVFGGVTILTMLGMVTFLMMGLEILPAVRLERFSHALAGASICLCGVAIQFLGL
jgi:sulfite exporter TauE/SafE